MGHAPSRSAGQSLPPCPAEIDMVYGVENLDQSSSGHPPGGEFLLPLWDNLPSVPDERHAVPRKCASVPRKRGAVSLAVWDSNHFCQDMCLTKIPHLTRLGRVHQSAHRPPRKPSTAVFVGRGRTNKTVCGLPSGRPNKVKFVLTRRGGI